MELYAIVKETIKNDILLSKIIKKSKIKKKSIHLKNEYLCKVLIYDLLIGHGISSIERKFVKPFIGELKAIYNKLKNDLEMQIAPSLTENCYPRFVRFNTLIKSTEEILHEIYKQGFVLKELQCKTYKEFIKFIQNLTSSEFTKDIHVDNLYVFSFETKLHLLNLFKNGSIILQDKASCLPAIVLNAESGSHVIDACAAPGNKTTHIAAILNNNGKIFAFDRDCVRLNTMEFMLKKASVKCVKTIRGDFLKSQPNHPMFSKVKYLLVDPSCSGSGILNRIREKKEEIYESRLKRLCNIQAMLLKHALSFPYVNRVVYSTCSLNHQENEGVVMEALQKYSHSFELISVLPTLPNRGNMEIFSEANKCLYMLPEIDRTNGFFVACFVRKENNNSPKILDRNITNKKSEQHNGDSCSIVNYKSTDKILKRKFKFLANSCNDEISKQNTNIKKLHLYTEEGLLKKKKINKNKQPVTKNN